MELGRAAAELVAVHMVSAELEEWAAEYMTAEARQLAAGHMPVGRAEWVAGYRESVRAASPAVEGRMAVVHHSHPAREELAAVHMEFVPAERLVVAAVMSAVRRLEECRPEVHRQEAHRQEGHRQEGHRQEDGHQQEGHQQEEHHI